MSLVLGEVVRVTDAPPTPVQVGTVAELHPGPVYELGSGRRCVLSELEFHGEPHVGSFVLPKDDESRAQHTVTAVHPGQAAAVLLPGSPEPRRWYTEDQLYALKKDEAAIVLRVDLASGEPLASPVQLPNGSWVLEGYATRAGVFRYLNPDGTERFEFRPPEEVARTAPELALCALTLEHPEEGIVTPENAERLQKGLVLESRWEEEGQRVLVRCVVTHEELLRHVAAGKSQLSCGYGCRVVPEAGEYQGMKYTHRQLGIRYNHLAVVDAGRAGPECALRLDSAGNVLPQSTAPVDTPAAVKSDDVVPPTYEMPASVGEELPVMEKEIVVNGITFRVPQPLAEAIMAERAMQQEKQKTAVGEADAAKLAMDEDLKEALAAQAVLEQEKAKLLNEQQVMGAKMDSLKGELESAKKLHMDATDPDKSRERIKSRLSLERQVRPVLGENYNYDGTDMQLKADALEKMLGDKSKDLSAKLAAAVKDKNEVYVSALFDAEISRFGQQRADATDSHSPVTPPPATIDASSMIRKQQQERAAAKK